MMCMPPAVAAHESMCASPGPWLPANSVLRDGFRFRTSWPSCSATKAAKDALQISLRPTLLCSWKNAGRCGCVVPWLPITLGGRCNRIFGTKETSKVRRSLVLSFELLLETSHLRLQICLFLRNNNANGRASMDFDPNTVSWVT